MLQIMVVCDRIHKNCILWLGGGFIEFRDTSFFVLYFIISNKLRLEALRLKKS